MIMLQAMADFTCLYMQGRSLVLSLEAIWLRLKGGDGHFG